jgi:hypothetical protein
VSTCLTERFCAVAPPTAAFEIAAAGWVEAQAAELRTLRSKPAAGELITLPGNYHRYSDELSIVGLEAQLRAIRKAGWKPADLSDWGVASAPRYPGRLSAAKVLYRFAARGPLAASPFVISHNSLHSGAGEISLALHIHGPTFGVGGGTSHVADGFLAGWSALSDGRLPGVWIVLAAWDPEPAPDTEGVYAGDPVCRGIALAVRPVRDGSTIRLNFYAGRSAAASTLAELVAFWRQREAGMACATWQHPLSGVGSVAIEESGE